MIFLASSLLLVAIACGSSTPEKQVSIERISWILYNVEHQVFIAPWLYVPAYENGSYLPIGNIELTNGKTASNTLLVPAPGETTTKGATYVFTENYANADNPPAGHTPLPKRATIQSATINVAQSTLDIDFSVTDGLVYSGWVEFYNTNGSYIGCTGTAVELVMFRDLSTGELASFLNSGSAFHTEGTTNILSLNRSQLYFVDNASFENITFVRVILTDGQQYANSDHIFSTLSISAGAPVIP